MQKIKEKSWERQTRRPATVNRGMAQGKDLNVEALTYASLELIFEELEGDERSGEKGDIGVCHAFPKEAQIPVQSTHAVRTSWPPEASLGLFIPLVYPIQGEAVEQ